MEACVELSFNKFCKVFCFFGGGVEAQYFNVSGIPNEILVGAGSLGVHVQDHAILHAPQRGLGSAVLIEREVEGVEVCREGLHDAVERTGEHHNALFSVANRSEERGRLSERSQQEFVLFSSSVLELVEKDMTVGMPNPPERVRVLRKDLESQWDHVIVGDLFWQ